MAAQCNVGGVDRTARLTVGSALVSAGLFTRMPTSLKIASVVLGTVGLVTGLVGYCPINQMAHFDTCHTPGSESE